MELSKKINKLQGGEMKAVVYSGLNCVWCDRVFEALKATHIEVEKKMITDEGVKKYKREPIIPFEQRIEIVSSIKYVDMVVKQNNRSGEENIKKLGNISVLIRGDDAEIPDEIERITCLSIVTLACSKAVSTSPA